MFITVRRTNFTGNSERRAVQKKGITMYPLKLKPPLKDYIWGGTKLRDEFGKQSDLSRLAESWELSCRSDGMSIIENGEYSGRTISDFLADNPDALGKNCEKFEYFPVLIKLIDACDDLSVQVHPDNEYALRFEGEYGKTEMLYIVDCDEGASIIYGFKEKISSGEFLRAIEDNTLLDKLKRVPVSKGDVFFIKSGTLHAIGKGIVIAEIQQNSNTTYRVCDYGRLGADGKPRELNIEKAIDVTECRPAQEHKIYPPVRLGGANEGTSIQLLGDCEYFTVTKADLDNSYFRFEADEKSFRHILVISGSGKMLCGGESYMLEKGSSYFIPASSGIVEINGQCSIINTEINNITEE